MSFWSKLKSRKFWVAVAGMATGVSTDNPVLSVIIGGVYVLVEGMVDALRRETAPEK
jgi:hypothetical protein